MNEFQKYIDHGWSLCRIPLGTKGPTDPGWIKRPITVAHDGWNHGLIHELSGTMALDVDDMTQAQDALMTRGIDLVLILTRPEMVLCHTGVPNHAKAMFRLPFPLPSKKIVIGGKDILNFRCMGCQDVLPPSVHPSGAMYQWAGDWRNLPELPKELLDVWSELLNPPVAASSPVTAEDVDRETIKAALRSIDPDIDRKGWIEIGMALHSADPNLFDLWDAWSAGSTSKYPGEQATRRQWASFKGRADGITIHTLYHHARKGGWKPSLELAKKMFKGTKTIDPAQYLIEGMRTPRLPVECFPKLLAEYSSEVSQSVGSHVSVSIAAGLVSICGAADSRSRLWMADRYSVPPVIWATSIGPPSSKKSPATRPMFEPLITIEAEDRARYQAELIRWEGQEALHVATKKQYLAQSGNLLNANLNTVIPPPTTLPPKPVPLRFILTDATSQKLVRLLEERPRGMSCFLDEGAGWLNRVTNVRSGEDRGCWVTSYESAPYFFDRVGSGSIFLENMALSMHMNVQPRVIQRFIGEMQADGLAQRFAPFLIDPENASTVSQPVPEWMSKAREWEYLLRSIYAAGKRDYHLCDQGKQIIREFEKRLEKQKRLEAISMSNEGFQSAIGKLMGFLGRLILVFHITDDVNNPLVSPQTVLNAEKVVEDYFQVTIEQFHDQDESFDKWLFDWLITGDEEFVSEGDIRKSVRKRLEGNTMYEQKEIIAMSCAFLEKLGVLMGIEGARAGSTPHYAVNPIIRERFKERRKEVASLKQAKLDRSRQIVEEAGKTTPKKWARGYDPEEKTDL